MTKKELKEKMLEYINLQDDEDKDEWYASNRCFAESILGEFAKYLNIDLTVNSVQIKD